MARRRPPPTHAPVVLPAALRHWLLEVHKECQHLPGHNHVLWQQLQVRVGVPLGTGGASGSSGGGGGSLLRGLRFAAEASGRQRALHDNALLQPQILASRAPQLRTAERGGRVACWGCGSQGGVWSCCKKPARELRRAQAQTRRCTPSLTAHSVELMAGVPRGTCGTRRAGHGHNGARPKRMIARRTRHSAA